MNLKLKRAYEEEGLVKDIVEKFNWNYLNTEQIRCVFSKNSSAKRVLGRIWSTPKIFSEVFETKPLYIIELLENRYTRLSEKDKIKVLIHELLHIPKTFSGALSPHTKMAKTLNCKTVDSLFDEYMKLSGKEIKSEGFIETIQRLIR